MRFKQKFCEGYPVKCYKGGKLIDFPLKYKWQDGLWFELFEKHAEFIVQDIERARSHDRLVMYLSCPISNRGGGYSGTNVEIAEHTAMRLKMKWGSRLWVLNPAMYQMESKEGTGLIKRHARTLSLEKKLKYEIDVNVLAKKFPPTGGDYLRMWTRVLAEDGGQNLGGRFDGFYFLGPSDVWHFFTRDGAGAVTLTEGIEQYFMQKFGMDSDFRAYFEKFPAGSEEWQKIRNDFFRFYAMRASSIYSLGCRDEFNIWRALNIFRVEDIGIESQIAGYFDGRQIDSSVFAKENFSGYAISEK